MSKRVCLGVADLKEGELRGVEVDKRMILLARDAGRVHALDNWCNHAGCLLSGGRVERNLVICPCHEVGFELATGRVATTPRLCDDQQHFASEERDGQIWVELPDEP